jgi:O-antigen ligase
MLMRDTSSARISARPIAAIPHPRPAAVKGAPTVNADRRQPADWVTPSAIALLAFVGLRVHESIRYLALVHGGAIITYGAAALAVTKAQPNALRFASRDRVTQLTAAYFLWALVTAPFALWPALAFSVAKFAPIVLLMVVVVLMCPPRKTVVVTIVWGFCVAAAILGLESMLFGSYVAEATGGRLRTSGGLDPNDLAAIMALSFPLALGIITRQHGLKRALGVLMAAFYVVVIMLTASRGGLLALAAGTVIFAFSLRGKQFVLVTLSLLVAATIAWRAAPDTFRERMLTLSTISEDYNFTLYTGREQVWRRGRGYFFEHPFAGVGAENFPVAEGDYAATLGRPAKWSAPHNAYLQAFAELGVVGGVLFLSLMGLTARRAYALWRRDGPNGRHRPEFLASLGAFASSACFLSHAYFYALFGLCAVISLAHRAFTHVPISAVQPDRAPRRSSASVPLPLAR